MEFFAKKNIWKKIVIIFLLISSFSFISPEPVEASVGGELMEPICNFLIGIGDGVVNVLHRFILNQNTSLIRVSQGVNLAKVMLLIVSVVVFAILIVSGVGALAGAACFAEALATIGSVAVETLKVGVVVGILFFAVDGFSNEIPLPLYTLTPDSIVKNEIPLFDVNFINPTENTIKYKLSSLGTTTNNNMVTDTLNNGSGDLSKPSNEEAGRQNVQNLTGMSLNDFINYNAGKVEGYKDKDIELNDGAGTVEHNYYRKINGVLWHVKQVTSDTTENRKIEINRINIDDGTVTNGNEASSSDQVGEIHAFSYELQEIIAKWYKRLRILAVVGMMSVLVYIGIRILLSSTSSQKAKYKQLIGDWLVGMLLLFSMHYIMNFSNIAVGKFTDILAKINQSQSVAVIPDVIGQNEGLIKQTLDKMKIAPTDGDKTLYVYHEDDDIAKNGKKYIEWHTDLMGLIRIKAFEYKDTDSESYIGYTVMFIVMIIYTVIFSFTYIKRVLYMAFLTLISPLVALTYPIDKANDGKAQGFDYWFKEYMFNLLLQPMHLLIYTVLISSAIELCQKNWIYALVATGFITSAEKIVRTMFNFSKASTPGAFAGPAGAALTISGMKWLMGHGQGDKKNKSESGESNNENSSVKGVNPTKIRGSLGGGSTDDSQSDGTGGSIPNVQMNDNSDSDSASETLDNLFNGDNSENDKTVNVTNNPLKKGISNLIPNGGNKSTSKKKINLKQNNGRIQGFKNVANRLVANKRNSILQNAKEGKPLRTLGGALGAATLGTVGLAAGVASGDLSKAFQDTAIGIAGGYKLGSGMVGSASDNLDIEGLKETYGRGTLGSKEYDAKETIKYAEEYGRRQDVISGVQKKFNLSSWEEAKDKTNELTKEYGVQEGIFDYNEWKKLEDVRDAMSKNGKRATRQQAVAAKKTYEHFYDKNKSKNEMQKSIQEQLNVDASSAKIMSDAMLKYNDVINFE